MFTAVTWQGDTMYFKEHIATSISAPSHGWRTLTVLLVAALVGCNGDEGPTGPTVGQPAQLVFDTEPIDGEAGALFAPPLTVAIQDEAGNVVSTATNAVTVALDANSAGGTLLGTTTVNAVEGVATFSDLSIERAGGGYSLLASSGTLTSATSAGFAVTPAAAAQLAFTVEPTDAEVNVPVTPPVQIAIQDAFGNLVTTASDPIVVVIESNPGAGLLSGTVTMDAVNGVASFTDLSINRVGAGYTLRTTSGSLTDATSSAFEIVFPIAVVSAGEWHTCGLTAGGNAYCWGDNSWGELGDGTTADRLTPVLVSGGLNLATVSAGSGFTCGLTIGGEAYCWGLNSIGQLGDGTGTDGLTPTLVSGGLSFATVGAGFGMFAGQKGTVSGHTCGVTTAAGDAYCWGANDDGQLGDGTWNHQWTPVLASGGLSFIAVSAGLFHTCGFTISGDAYCWGWNGSGQLGSGIPGSSNTPVAVAGGLSFASVSAWNHSCGLTTGGDAYCWGFNSFGRLGDGTTDNRTTPVPVSGGLSFAVVSAGSEHTCGLTVGGDAYCWGNNRFGQLGDGTQTQRLTPVPVSGGLSFVAVNAGAYHSCGITTGGDAYCWGVNFAGQLGDGTTIDRLTPVRVSGP